MNVIAVDTQDTITFYVVSNEAMKALEEKQKKVTSMSYSDLVEMSCSEFNKMREMEGSQNFDFIGLQKHMRNYVGPIKFVPVYLD